MDHTTVVLATLHLGAGGSTGARAAALVIVGVAGIAAGMINAVVGSGSLFTFPTLLALGVPPIAANVSNNMGLVPGNVAAAWGYRRELAGQRRRTTGLVPASLLGSVVGAVLLLKLPATAFSDVVPVLIAVAVVLVFVQPRIQARLRRRTEAEGATSTGKGATSTGGGVSPLMVGGVFLAGVYGGYFGAAQGVLLIGLLGSLVVETLQRLNAVKNVLALVVNATAAVLFAVFASTQIRWPVVVAIAIGSTIGGILGARVGRRLSPTVLRVVIAVVGVAAIVKLLA